jgi:hypothetical protein
VHQEQVGEAAEMPRGLPLVGDDRLVAPVPARSDDREADLGEQPD